MQEIRRSGSEGGETEINPPSLPLSFFNRCDNISRRLVVVAVKSTWRKMEQESRDGVRGDISWR
jgi:hypothetical protein